MDLPVELTAAIEQAYGPAGLLVRDAGRQAESADYGACSMHINALHVLFRVAKTTPTKLGQFVTLWKRESAESEIAPIDSQDSVDFVVVSVRAPLSEVHLGQFVFSRAALLAKGVMSRNGKGGKRALRVYPPWVRSSALPTQAIATQRWQLEHFVPFNEDGSADTYHLIKAFGVH
jgi:hypothetical protein